MTHVERTVGIDTDELQVDAGMSLRRAPADHRPGPASRSWLRGMRPGSSEVEEAGTRHLDALHGTGHTRVCQQAFAELLGQCPRRLLRDPCQLHADRSGVVSVRLLDGRSNWQMGTSDQPCSAVASQGDPLLRHPSRRSPSGLVRLCTWLWSSYRCRLCRSSMTAPAVISTEVPMAMILSLGMRAHPATGLCRRSRYSHAARRGWWPRSLLRTPSASIDWPIAQHSALNWSSSTKKASSPPPGERPRGSHSREV